MNFKKAHFFCSAVGVLKENNFSALKDKQIIFLRSCIFNTDTFMRVYIYIYIYIYMCATCGIADAVFLAAFVVGNKKSSN